MKLVKIFSFFAILIGSCGFALEMEEDCLAPAQLTLSQHFGRGVGHKGYSSAELYFVHSSYPSSVPYLDARFHMMSDGRFASNIGAGLRYLVIDDFLSIGGNLYYDFRDSKELNTHQVGPGIEILSPYIDFRANGYIPVGGTKHSEPLKFDSFSGNQINTKRKTYYAFPSVNAEIGIPTPIIPMIDTDFYLGIGPYYLFGATVSGNKYPSSWGGKLRVNANITQYFSLEFEMNHDSIFDTTYQGVVSVNIPLWKLSACRSGERGYGKRAFRRGILRPPVRNEIIPVKEKSRVQPLRDQNGNIIPIFFVNNLSSFPGLGTFESPFCSFAFAPTRPVIVYVFQGTGTPVPNYNTGFVMSPGQTLQGSGVSFNVGGIKIPPFTPGNPVLFGPTAAVGLASNTVVRGINFEGMGVSTAGVGGIDISNVTIENNNFNGFSLVGVGNGIRLQNFSGRVNIVNNTITNSYSGVTLLNAPQKLGVVVASENTIRNNVRGIQVGLNDLQSTALISNNTITTTVPTPFSADISASSGVSGRFIISNNVIDSFSEGSIGGSSGHQIISNNSIINRAPGAPVGIGYLGDGLVAANQVHVVDNNIQMITPSQDAISITNSGGFFSAEIRGNNVLGSNAAISIAPPSPDPICSSIKGNSSPRFVLDGSGGGPVNVIQSESVYKSMNSGISFTELGAVNFNSSCQ